MTIDNASRISSETLSNLTSALCKIAWTLSGFTFIVLSWKSFTTTLHTDSKAFKISTVFTRYFKRLSSAKLYFWNIIYFVNVARITRFKAVHLQTWVFLLQIFSSGPTRIESFSSICSEDRSSKTSQSNTGNTCRRNSYFFTFYILRLSWFLAIPCSFSYKQNRSIHLICLFTHLLKAW